MTTGPRHYGAALSLWVLQLRLMNTDPWDDWWNELHPEWEDEGVEDEDML